MTSALLALLVFGAYIPVGFMPAAGTPFLLELCPVATPLPMSMRMPGHHHHGQGATHDHVDTCPFGSAPGAGPLSQRLVFFPPARASASVALLAESPPIANRLPRAHPPRGPPIPA